MTPNSQKIIRQFGVASIRGKQRLGYMGNPVHATPPEFPELSLVQRSPLLQRETKNQVCQPEAAQTSASGLRSFARIVRRAWDGASATRLFVRSQSRTGPAAGKRFLGPISRLTADSRLWWIFATDGIHRTATLNSIIGSWTKSNRYILSSKIPVSVKTRITRNMIAKDTEKQPV
jgi:hypothetical protein